MKHQNKLALLLGVGALLPSALIAASTEQSYIDSCPKGPNVPVPVEVVAPDAVGWDIGHEARIEFTVDTAGRPTDITVLSTNDSELADSAIDAVKLWRFTPAERNGVAVSTKVILPVRVEAIQPERTFRLD